MPCTSVSSLSLRAAVDKLDLDPRERAIAISSIEYIAYIETLDEEADEDDRNPASASTSELISPIEGDSTTPPTSASVASPLSPVVPAPVRTKRDASESVDDGLEEKVPRLRGGAGGADHDFRLARAVYDHKNSVDRNGFPEQIFLPGEMIRPDGGAPVPANREAAVAANAVYDLAEKALQGFRMLFGHTVYMQENPRFSPHLRLVIRFGCKYVAGIISGSPSWSCACFGQGDGSVFTDAALNSDMYEP